MPLVFRLANVTADDGQGFLLIHVVKGHIPRGKRSTGTLQTLGFKAMHVTMYFVFQEAG